MPCSVPTRNLVGWGWEQEGAAVSRMDTPQCGGQQEILLQPEPWDPPPWRDLGTGTPELGPPHAQVGVWVVGTVTLTRMGAKSREMAPRASLS